MQYEIYRGDEGPVLVQYQLRQGQQLDVWTNAAAISEGVRGGATRGVCSERSLVCLRVR
jgi:hypothetical protein